MGVLARVLGKGERRGTGAGLESAAVPLSPLTSAMRLSSSAPSATRRRASSSSGAHGLERKRPRKPGIEQNVHAWLQPSATRRYAVWRGVRRTRSHSARNGTVASPTCTRADAGADGDSDSSPPPPPASAPAGSSMGGGAGIATPPPAGGASTGARPRLPRRLLPSCP